MKKLKATIDVLCDHAMIGKDGKLSIIGIFDRIFVRQTPLKYPKFFVVFVLTGEPTSKHKLTLNLESPSGEELLNPKELNISLGANGKANVTTAVNNLNLGEIGEYRFTLKHDNNKVSHCSLFINRQPEKTAQPN